MSSESLITPDPDPDTIEIDSMSIDQLAGAIVLVLGAIGSLLLVVWQSRCMCRCRIGCSDKCYLFDCERSAPPTDEEKAVSPVEDSQEKSPKAEPNEESILPPPPQQQVEEGGSPPEPEPEPEILQDGQRP